MTGDCRRHRGLHSRQAPVGASEGEVRAPMDQRRWPLQPGDLPRVHQALAQVHKRHGEARERQSAQGTPDAAFVEHD